MSSKKSGEEKRFNEFNIEFVTPLYSLTSTTERIIEEEAKQCNSDYIQIMQANKNIIIKKFQTGDLIKIYTIIHETTDTEWSFALRNCVQDVPK